MQQRSLVFILLLLLNTVKAQSFDNDFTWLQENNKGIKQITISNNGKVGVIQQFDRAGNVIFIKNNELNGDNVFAVWYFHYDKDNRNDKTVFGHSNVGFEIDSSHIKNDTEYRFTYLTKDAEEFIKSVTENANETEVSAGNFNEFSYLNEIKKINDTTALLNSKSYLELLSRKKYLNKETKYNKNKLEVSSTSYNYLGEIEDTTTWKYGKKLISISYNNNVFGIKNLVERKTDDNGKIISEKIDNKTTTFKFENNKLREKSIFENNKLLSKMTFIYSDNLLTKQIYEDEENDIKSVDSFEYNEKGKLKTAKLDQNEGVTEYKYDYIYW